MSAEELREAVASATETPVGNGACDAVPDWRAEVARLASLPPIEADREMKACAKALRAYPIRPAWRQVMSASAKWSMAR